MSFNVTVDRDLCQGAGQCVLRSPLVFDQDDEGLVVLVRPDVPEEEREAAADAAYLCPAGAISVHE
ncbi:ferredoxin [Streptomyces sp. NRRL F-5126]|uniref:ferredoxin n=1 Tax=Streptomyces sp. NRRL F-5126 TaxID=1463857 RepID=UPI0004CBCFBE|nr:ferredoxin [Streptomyces sp. NRRL F-5126]